MPFHLPRHNHTLSDPSSSHDNYYSAANAIYQSGQTLGSVGAPTQQYTPKTIPSTNPQNRTYQYHPQNGNASLTPQNPVEQGALNLPHTVGATIESQTYYTPSRQPTVNKSQQEDLYSRQQGSAMSDVHHYGAPPSYGSENVTPNHQLPGTLQPGLPQRPNMHLSSANTAPTLPTLPQIQTQMQQPPLSARPSVNHSHSYSRSSPGGFDTPKYKPFSNKTPEASKYIAPPGNYAPPPGVGPSSYSPLGLADIRPRTDVGMPDTTYNPSQIVENVEMVQYPTNSNYVTPWPIYAVDWCKWAPKGSNVAAGKVAIGSYLEDNHNYIQILDAQRTQVNPEDPHGERGLEFTKTAEATHSYPVTRILWEPPSSNKQSTDLLATSGDHLRLWSLPAEQSSLVSNSITQTPKSVPLQKLSPLALLSNSKSPEHTAPITSLDWNVVQPSLIITSSIDTTCTIWDIPTLTAKTQLIAHDKEVFDVRFCANSVDVFVSCGADGSVRMFDLRSLEHSTIIYEPSEKTDKTALSPNEASQSPTRGGGHTMSFPPPLLRIAASPHDSHLLATFSQDSSVIRILDVRQPGQALLELKGHNAPVNCMEWSNFQRGVLASGADDCCVMLWDLMGSSVTNSQVPGQTPGQQNTGQERGPSASWECGYEVGNLSWSPVSGTLGVCGGRGFWGVQL